MNSNSSDDMQHNSPLGAASGQRGDRRTILRTAAASSLAAALIGVGGRGERAAAQPVMMPPTPEDMAVLLTQWIINPNGPHGEILTKNSFEGNEDRNYSLKGMDPATSRSFLQWEGQAWGINLGWTGDAHPNTEKRVRRWFFLKDPNQPGGTEGPVHYGDTIALGNGGQPSWLYYTSRYVGINLDWSNSPVFEWKILGGEAGRPVKTNERVAIFNVKTNDRGGEPLIYFDRTVGGDIGWPTSERWEDQIDWKEVARAAIQILIYLGSEESATQDDIKRAVEEG